MKLTSFLKLSTFTQRKIPKSWREYQQELLIKQGREQFKKLLDKGLRVPVVLL